MAFWTSIREGTGPKTLSWGAPVGLLPSFPSKKPIFILKAAVESVGIWDDKKKKDDIEKE